MAINLSKDYSQTKEVDKNNNEDNIQAMIRKNLELTEEIHDMIKGIKRHMFWSNVWGFLKILIIIIPLIVGIIFLPPLLKGIFDQYKDVLGLEDMGQLLDGSSVEKIPLDINILKNGLNNLPTKSSAGN